MHAIISEFTVFIYRIYGNKLLVREQIKLLHIQYYSCTTEKKISATSLSYSDQCRFRPKTMK